MSKLAFVFSGQGSQTVGMLQELIEQKEIVKNTFLQANEILGYDLLSIVLNGSAEELNQTHITQPALLTCSYALWQLWEAENGDKPEILAGHSLGEYSALLCAGVLNFADALKLVEYRGKLMQDAVPVGVGAMSAIIGLEDKKIIQACEQAQENQICSAVNFNSKGQVVIAGNKEAVERANIICKEMGAKRALLLPVSVPSHCDLMHGASMKLAQYLENLTFNQPQIPVINNADVKIETDEKAIKQALVKQLYSPVRWVEVIEKISSMNTKNIIECGAGKVLTGLIKRIDKTLGVVALNDLKSLENALNIGK